MKHLAEHAETWGIQTGKVSFNFAKVMARKNRMVKDFAGHRVQQLNAGKFKFIRANARFLDAHTVELWPIQASQRGGPTSSPALSPNGGEGGRRPGEEAKLTARHFVIATGSSVAPSPLPQLDQISYLNSDDAVALKKLPKSLIILGGRRHRL
ncbi:MAG: FAD-dependent oxidoreductase [Limisphaerales bacterium]